MLTKKKSSKSLRKVSKFNKVFFLTINFKSFKKLTRVFEKKKMFNFQFFSKGKKIQKFEKCRKIWKMKTQRKSWQTKLKLFLVEKPLAKSEKSSRKQVCKTSKNENF